MGKKILNELITNTKVEIAGAVARSGNFTTKECMLDCLKAAVKFKTPLVSGTTGIEGVDLKEYAAEVPILWSANMSVGVNVLLKLWFKHKEKGGIGFAVSRGGGVIGDHSVMFVNSDERIELNHKAIDRTTFAKELFKQQYAIRK
ncbi:4-hydroxy-tetrahydrodipicolinate reductase [Trichonephila clavata]|uniref:4-hydroxy-tetrahydrodipicolinate reductase n=1 Tax=Trichonephila clavata TaxID=2740835 RepID=A0A8X6GFT8_TRICU|nr:4-hydroxy-tetrahydrodipicolinate reductase [Trichonephila clavata]